MLDINGNLEKKYRREGGLDYKVYARVSVIPKKSPLICKTCKQEVIALAIEEARVERLDDGALIKAGTPIAEEIKSMLQKDITFLDLPGRPSCHCREK